MALTEVTNSGEGLTEEIGSRGESAMRVFIGDSWANRKADVTAAGLIFGAAFPGNANLLLSHIRYTGAGASGTGVGSEYTHVKVTCTYSSEYLLVGSSPRWLYDFGCDVLMLAGGRYWYSDGATVPDNITQGVTISYAELIAEKVQLALNDDVIQAQSGCVNAYAWIPPGLTKIYAPETMLFVGANTRCEYHCDYGRIARIQYRFRVLPWSQNLFWRSDLGIWDRPIPLIYPIATFFGLL